MSRDDEESLNYFTFKFCKNMLEGLVSYQCIFALTHDRYNLYYDWGLYSQKLVKYRHLIMTNVYHT